MSLFGRSESSGRRPRIRAASSRKSRRLKESDFTVQCSVQKQVIEQAAQRIQLSAAIEWLALLDAAQRAGMLEQELDWLARIPCPICDGGGCGPRDSPIDVAA